MASHDAPGKKPGISYDLADWFSEELFEYPKFDGDLIAMMYGCISHNGARTRGVVAMLLLSRSMYEDLCDAHKRFCVAEKSKKGRRYRELMMIREDILKTYPGNESVIFDPI
jgi:hypothetical protein